MAYAEVEIMPFPKKPTKSKVHKQSSLTSIVIGSIPIPKSIPGSNRQRSQSTLTSADSGDGDVVYAPLDFKAMTAVAQIREEHRDIRNFEGLLKRHDVREMELEEQRRRKLNIM